METATKIVNIPKRFKEDLEARFNPDNAVFNASRGVWGIEKMCPLCSYYHRGDKGKDCEECPFGIPYRIKAEEMFYELAPCSQWIYENFPSLTRFVQIHYAVSWAQKDDDMARRFLKGFMDKANTLIEWVDKEEDVEGDKSLRGGEKDEDEFHILSTDDTS